MSLRDQADRRFADALAATGARDPRDFYRGELKTLKESDPAAYRKALEYFDQKLIPAIATDEGDPLGEWLEYGRYLASLRSEGRTVQIDTTGRATPYNRPVPVDHLVLHLPTSARESAFPVGLPPELSPAQKATYDLLVRQRVSSSA